MSDQAQEYLFSKAQLRHFNELQTNVRRAQEELQAFVDYLGEEHDLDQTKKWMLGTRGFVQASPEQVAQMQQGQEQFPPMPMPMPNQGGQNGHPVIDHATQMPVRDEG